MSLRVDDRKGRSRSKSPGGKRERSRSNIRAPSPGPQYYSSGAHHTEATPQYHVRQPSASVPAPPPQGDPITMGNYADLPPNERPAYMQQAQAAQQYQYQATAQGGQTSAPGVSYAQPLQYAQGGAAQYSYTAAPAAQGGPTRNPQTSGGFQYAATPAQITFTAKPVVPTSQSQQQPTVRYTLQPANQSQGQSTQQQQQQQQQQAQHQQQQYYTTTPQPPQAAPTQPIPPPPFGPPPQQSTLQPNQPSHGRSRSHSRSGHAVVEIVPGGAKPPPSPGLRPHSLSVHGQRPDSLNNRMDRLSVSGNRPDIQTIVPGGMPPPSPMLEAYRGTYQSISPMPSPMMLPNDDLDDIPSLDALSPRASNLSVGGGHHRAHSRSRHSPSPPDRHRPRDRLALEAAGLAGGEGGRELALRRDDRDRDYDRDRERGRRVKIYDASDDALALVDALSRRPPTVDTLIDILPALSHDQMLELRAEYKRHCKVQGRGINIAKHIKLKITGNFGKICYVTALGRYESEGYWANYWYQSNSARRELLIEALMGRQNHEIREIKDAFKDKRYGDSLTRCMDKELKADKFRKAVLMALEGERQEESDVWAIEYRNRDADTLYKAIKSREGGESMMLGVVVMRSDAHLREVLRTYERKYGGNFARDALRKSNNLVGEIIAHILNGVINRPARDSMLLHHALIDLIEPDPPSNPKSSSSRLPKETSKHERQNRIELLISRLVRLHWDRLHLMRVKREYEEKYGRVVEEDIEEATKGDFREFCIAICQTGPR